MYLLVVKYIAKFVEMLLMALSFGILAGLGRGRGGEQKCADSLKYLLLLTNGTKNNILSHFFFYLVFFILLWEAEQKLLSTDTGNSMR